MALLCWPGNIWRSATATIRDRCLHSSRKPGPADNDASKANSVRVTLPTSSLQYSRYLCLGLETFTKDHSWTPHSRYSGLSEHDAQLPLPANLKEGQRR